MRPKKETPLDINIKTPKVTSDFQKSQNKNKTQRRDTKLWGPVGMEKQQHYNTYKIPESIPISLSTHNTLKRFSLSQ
jgi:hypothetical protein